MVLRLYASPCPGRKESARPSKRRAINSGTKRGGVVAFLTMNGNLWALECAQFIGYQTMSSLHVVWIFPRLLVGCCISHEVAHASTSLIPMIFSEVARLARTQDKLQALRHKTAGKREIFTGGRFRSSHQFSHHQKSVIQAGLALFSTPVKLLLLVGFGVF